jgi:hypothetical protein
MTRYQHLQERREKLIELNQRYNYVAMVRTKEGLVPNPKSEQYFNLLLQINKECVKLRHENEKKIDKSNYKFSAI